ncbi:hypothetical protein C6050_18510, partial [Salmonella enterica]|nr:hypothetical protein [Salmonella enterica]
MADLIQKRIFQHNKRLTIQKSSSELYAKNQPAIAIIMLRKVERVPLAENKSHLTTFGMWLKIARKTMH